MTSEEDLGAKDENSIEYFELTDEQENFLNSLDTIDLDSKVDMANIDFFMNRINGGHRLRNVQHKGDFSRLKRD